MKSALDIAHYFLGRVDKYVGETISHLKLQKLVYYAQVWSLIPRNQPLFYQDIQAWRHGPVVYEVWTEYKAYGFDAIPALENPSLKFEDDEMEVLDYVWGSYGELSAKRLEILTHSEEPWIKAREGVDPTEKSNNVISHEDIKSYYGSKSPWGILSLQKRDWLEGLVYELLKSQGQLDASYSSAILRIKNTVLDVIEREHPSYEQAMTKALEEALDGSNDSPTMTPDEFRDWFTRL